MLNYESRISAGRTIKVSRIERERRFATKTSYNIYVYNPKAVARIYCILPDRKTLTVGGLKELLKDNFKVLIEDKPAVELE